MRRVGRLLALVGAACLIGGLGRAGGDAPSVPALPALKDVAPEVIVTVNGTPVSRESLAALAILLDRDRLLDALITVEVVRQEAVRRGVGVTAAEIEAESQRATAEELDAAAQRLGAKSQADLVARGKMSVEEAAAERARLAAWYRPMAAFNLLTEKLMRQDLKVGDDDVRAEFDRQYGPRARVQQIVLRTRTEAEETLNRLNAGADFAQLARDLSLDRVSARAGGELPPQPRGSPLGDAAFALKPGQISPVLQTPDGFHLIKVLELIPGENRNFDELRETLRRDVTARLLRERRPFWLRELRAKSIIRPSADISGVAPQ